MIKKKICIEEMTPDEIETYARSLVNCNLLPGTMEKERRLLQSMKEIELIVIP